MQKVKAVIRKPGLSDGSTASATRTQTTTKKRVPTSSDCKEAEVLINPTCLRYVDDTILMAENEEELKSLSVKVKEESEKAGLKLNIQKMKIMASSPITSWQTDGETVEAVTT